MLSVGIAVTITALLVFVVAFILGALFGILLLYLIQLRNCCCDVTTKIAPTTHEYYNVGVRGKQLVKSPQKETTPVINQDPPTANYEDISIPSETEDKENKTEKIKLEENKAYGPREVAVGNRGFSLQENVSYVPVNQ